MGAAGARLAVVGSPPALANAASSDCRHWRGSAASLRLHARESCQLLAGWRRVLSEFDDICMQVELLQHHKCGTSGKLELGLPRSVHAGTMLPHDAGNTARRRAPWACCLLLIYLLRCIGSALHHRL